MAQSTHKTYSSGQQHYLRFCQQTDLQPIPASEHQLMLFAAYLALKGLKWQTIKTYLSAVRHFHLLNGPQDNLPTEVRPRLQLMLRGIKKATSARPIKARLPITPDILRQVWRVVCSLQAAGDSLMLWAAMTTCFFGFLRAGEACCPTASTFDPSWHLCITDIALDSHVAPTKLFLTIKASKTDPFRQGVTITLGKTGQQLCPMTSILPYLAQRGAKPGPLFCFADGSFLTRKRFVREVRGLLASAGIDPAPYSGHSFRIGAATAAAQAGLDAALIQTLGRWKSSAYQLYIRIPRDSLASVTSLLAAVP